jgi:hypothetical protein
VVVRPLAFRGGLPPEPARPHPVAQPLPAAQPGVPPDTAAAGTVVGAVPPAAVASFQRLTGVDLGHVPLARGPEVSRTAAELGARAYSHDGVVHVPPEAGPLDRADNEALLGHELAHVAQQRALGPLAAEAGPHGDELESAARAAERALRGEETDPPATDGGALGDILAGLGGPDAGNRLTWTPMTGLVGQPLSPTVAFEAPQLPQVMQAPQRAPLADDNGSSSVVPAAEPTVVSPSVEATEPELAAEEDLVQAYLADLAAAIEASGEAAEARGLELDDATLTTIAGHLMYRFDQRYVVLTDSESLDRLAGRIYERLRSRIRMELLVDRERSGQLTEFR